MKKATSLQVRRNAGAILLLFFGLTITAIIGQTWWAIVQDKQLTLAAEKGNGLVAVRLLQEHATQTLQEAERKMLSVVQAIHASNEDLLQDESRIRHLVHEKLLDNGAIKALQFINRNGHAWVTSLDFPAHTNDVSKRAEVQFLLRHPEWQESVIGHPFQSRYDNQWVMPVVRNLYDRDNQWLGLISADVRVAYFADVYARAAKDNDATVSLIANSGFIVVRSPFEARYVDRDISASPVMQKIASELAEASLQHADFLDDEKARLYTYRKVLGFPITTVYGRDLQTIMAPWKKRSIDRILFSCATMLLLGMLTFYLRLHVRRLQQSKLSLRESENKFIGLFQHSPLPLALINLENDQFVEMNQVFLQQFGYQREELRGKTPINTHFWRNYADRQPYLDTLHRQQFVEKLEVQLLRKDGSGLICLLSSRLYEAMGAKMVIFSPIDVTRQRQIETEIRDLNQQLEQRVRSRTQRLEQTNLELAQTLQSLKDMQKELIHAEKMAALGALVAGVAHELNTPIGNSVTMASTMASDTEHILQVMRERNLRKSELDRYLSESADAAGTLLRNLVRAAELVSSFKQVAVDQASNQAREFDLRRVLEEMVRTCAPMYRERAITLEMDVPEDILLYSYPGPVSQAISNFITNAIHHGFEGRPGGRMYLRSRLLDEAQIEIVFGDDGNGITAENLARVFDPFFTTKLGQGGNGLGMHIVYNLVTGVLGGKIAISSEVGQGTQITMVLPLCAPGLQKNGIGIAA